MAAVDLHPDVVRAIHDLAGTKLGKRFDKFARRRYGVPGRILAAKQTAGEFGGRSTKTGRGVVSSAGARGPAQFIPSTREAFIQRYGIDPWKDDVSAIKGLMLHDLNTGVEGYNPGMSTYKDYVLGQKLNRADKRALKRGDINGNLTLSGPQRTQVQMGQRTIPGQSFAAERDAARRELLLSGDFDLEKLLAYKQQINSLQDVPSQTVSTGIRVKRTRGKAVAVPARRSHATGTLREEFYDPGVNVDDGRPSGAIGGHGDHVHVAIDNDHDRALVLRLARQHGVVVTSEGGGKHTTNSFHYRNTKRGKSRAIDFGGDPEALAQFNRAVARAFGIKEATGGRHGK